MGKGKGKEFDAANSIVQTKYVTLISSDGFEFVVLRDAAVVSGAIRRMLDPTRMSILPHRFLDVLADSCVV